MRRKHGKLVCGLLAWMVLVFFGIRWHWCQGKVVVFLAGVRMDFAALDFGFAFWKCRNKLNTADWKGVLEPFVLARRMLSNQSPYYSIEVGLEYLKKASGFWKRIQWDMKFALTSIISFLRQTFLNQEEPRGDQTAIIRKEFLFLNFLFRWAASIHLGLSGVWKW